MTIRFNDVYFSVKQTIFVFHSMNSNERSFKVSDTNGDGKFDPESLTAVDSRNNPVSDTFDEKQKRWAMEKASTALIRANEEIKQYIGAFRFYHQANAVPLRMEHAGKGEAEKLIPSIPLSIGGFGFACERYHQDQDNIYHCDEVTLTTDMMDFYSYHFDQSSPQYKSMRTIFAVFKDFLNKTQTK